MRVLHVHTTYGKKSIVARHVFDLMRLQEEAGHVVAPFAMRVTGNKKTVWSRYFSKTSHEVSGKMEEILESFKPDIVHVHSLEAPFSPRILTICERFGAPVLMTLHDDTLLEGGKRFLHVLTHYRDKVAFFLTVSQWQRKRFLEHGFNKKRIFLHYPFVPAGKEEYRKGSTILCIDYPGAEREVQLVKKVMKQFPEMKLVTVMPGIISEKVLADTRAAVFPASSGEPFDAQLMTLMRARIPVVVAEEGVFPELVERGVSGLMFDSARPETLQHALKEVIKSDVIAESLSEAAGDRADEIGDEGRYLKRILAYYATAIEEYHK